MPPLLFVLTLFGALLFAPHGYSAEATAAGPSDNARVTAPLDYQLGVGDLIRIQVHAEPDLGLETRLSEKGTITYPFLGEFKVVGLSVSQLQDRITTGLKGDYLLDPEVQVLVVEYRPFYVNGEVTRPGGYPFVPGLTVRKAVALAGGFTDRASTGKMYLLRENQKGDPYRVSLDDRLHPGDTLVIEEGLF